MAAHKVLPTSIIFSHLVSRARPIIGADNQPLSHRKAVPREDDNAGGPSAPAKRLTISKNKAKLKRVIGKFNRKKRLGGPSG